MPTETALKKALSIAIAGTFGWTIVDLIIEGELRIVTSLLILVISFFIALVYYTVQERR